MNKQKGFTLIELLVVIAIIGLLSTLAVISLNNARAKSRDAKRIADVKQIQSALELYFNDTNAYPQYVSPAGTIANGSVVYMSLVPSAPTPPAGNSYAYAWVSSGASYTLSFTLEGNTGGLNGPATHTASPVGIQ